MKIKKAFRLLAKRLFVVAIVAVALVLVSQLVSQAVERNSEIKHISYGVSQDVSIAHVFSKKW